MKLNDATLRALPLTEAGQRDYPDDLVRGLSIRVGKQTKTFMVLIRSGANRSRVKLGTYPECSLSRARQLARDKLAAARLAKDELPSITVAEALDTFYRIRGAEQRQSTRIRCQYLLDKFFRNALGSDKLETIKPSHLAPIFDEIESLAVRQNTFAFLQAFFAWSYRLGYIDTVPTA